MKVIFNNKPVKINFNEDAQIKEKENELEKLKKEKEKILLQIKEEEKKLLEEKRKFEEEKKKILEELKQKELEIIKKANTEAEQIKKQAFEQGYNEGIQKAQEDIKKELEKLKNYFNNIDKELNNAVKEIEKKLLNYSLEIIKLSVEKIVKKEKTDLKYIENIIMENLEELSDLDWVKIIIPISLIENLPTIKNKVQDILASVDKVEIKASPVQNEGITIETDRGFIDATFKTQIEKFHEQVDFIKNTMEE